MRTLREEIKSFKDEVREQFAGLFEVINVFANATEERFKKIESTMVTKDDLKHELSKFVTKDDLRQELTRELSKYVTKNELIDIFDRKIGEVRGDMNVQFKKTHVRIDQTNATLSELTSCLKRRKVIPAKDATRILRMQPFPQS